MKPKYHGMKPKSLLPVSDLTGSEQKEGPFWDLMGFKQLNEDKKIR